MTDGGEAIGASKQVSDQAKFASREFVARWLRETGEDPSVVIIERVLFAYEMGFLRGHGEGMRASGAMYDELLRRKVDDDESK